MDLSKVLDDVYDASNDKPAPSAPVVPAWADEQRLDAAFSGWTPGPPADAPAAEREMAASVGTTTAGTTARILDLEAPAPAPAFAPAPAGFTGVQPQPDPVGLPTAPPSSSRRWLRGDDDVQFGERSRGRRRRLGRH